MRADVPLQFVGSGESLATKEPVANERPFASVPPQVRLQVRSLVVDFAATGDVTRVDVAFPQVRSCRTQSVDLLAVGTVAGGPASVASLGTRTLSQVAE